MRLHVESLSNEIFRVVDITQTGIGSFELGYEKRYMVTAVSVDCQRNITFPINDNKYNLKLGDDVAVTYELQRVY